MITTPTNRNSYPGNGLATAFPYTFKITNAAHMKVILRDAEGVDQTLVLNVDYTVDGVGSDDGGTVTLTSVTPAVDESITLKRVVPITQTTDFKNQGNFFASRHEDAYDKQVMIAQDLDEKISRCAQMPEGLYPTFDTTIPAPVPRYALVVNDDATGFDMVPSTGADQEASWTAAIAAAVSGVLSTVAGIYKSAEQLAASAGSSLIGFIQAGVGAIMRTVQDKLRDSVSVFDFMTPAQIADVKAGTALSNYAAALDVTASLQAAIDYAHSISTGSATDGLGTFPMGGVRVKLPAGAYKFTTTLETYANVELVGAGRFSSALRSDYNGMLVRNHLPDTSYNPYAIGIKELSIIGNRTNANQVGISLMRAWIPQIHNVSVLQCGSDGVHLYQCVLHDLRNLDIQKCAGYGIVLDQGYSDWTLSTPSNYPTIDGRSTNGHFGFNDKAGIRLQGYHDSNQFIGGSSEQNNQSTPHVGYQIEITGVSIWPNEFIDVSGESNNGFAYILVNLSNVSSIVRFTRFHHSAVAGGTMDRCANVVQGRLIMDRPYGNAVAYRSLGGNVTPFQITKAAGSIRLHEPIGSTITNGVWVNDETNAVTGLYDNVFMTSREYSFGANLHRGSFGQSVQDYQVETEAYPWLSLQSFYKGIALGGGTAAPDAMIVRKAANVLGMDTGDSFQVGGIAGETLNVNAGTANGAVATTLGSVGPTGSTAGNPQGWFRINVAGTDRFVPYW